jgi:hypothetical protein
MALHGMRVDIYSIFFVLDVTCAKSTDFLMVHLLRNIHTEGNSMVESVDQAATLNSFWIMDANCESSEQVMLAPCTGLPFL